ncbi:transposase [Collinsella sp. AM18-10]|uniref:transposase n=1 Tax=Collinsella sp. AM18-10 TaxID=2292028 RepID=UPI0018F4002D|nr:transposase [Collinsella sp. AM18-10]
MVGSTRRSSRRGTQAKADRRRHRTCQRKRGGLKEAEPDALAHLAFPPARWKRLRTNNVEERANRERKRRSRVVQVFPTERSLEHLVGAVLCKQDEQWSASRCFAYDKMQELYDGRSPSPFRFAVLARAAFAVPSKNGLRQHSRHYLHILMQMPCS